MPNTQLILFTPVPASVRLNPASIKVSVLVSPRLRGDDTLAAYPDWLNWTDTRRESGLQITFECNATNLTIEVDTSQLRTDLWRSLFNAETFVRSHQFDDYSQAFVSSYSVRAALGLLKTTYQTVGVEFALPTDDGDPRERTGRRRGRFESLLRPYALQWTDQKGRQLRADQREAQGRLRDQLSTLRRSSRAMTGGVDESGLIVTGTLDAHSDGFRNAQTDLAKEFGVFSHVPQGAPVTRESLDDRRVLDFHQALSSLGAYPDLMRKLGLVFDLELPLDFVAETGSSTPGDLHIVAVEGDWNSGTPTTVPRTRTSYVHTEVEGQDLFAVAPTSMSPHARTQRPLVLGLLNLHRNWFGLAQVDVDGAMHKTLMHADNLSQLRGESVPQHPDVFDPATTLASLRSGGLSLFADSRALSMLDTFERSRRINEDLDNGNQQNGIQQREPFCAEDLTRGYRLDVWDSLTGDWHSLHRKNTTILIGRGVGGDGAIELTVEDEEGFFQAAATQAAPNKDGSRDNADVYLHEAMVRWAGWSLSAETVGNHLTRAADPERAVPNPQDPDPENEPVTPFKLTSSATHVRGSLPRLRFGVGYRLRVRQVDLAGNGLHLDDPETALLTSGFSMPQGDGVIPYLRFEPVVAPTIVSRDKLALTGEGSSSDRLVIRTFNADQSLDEAPADLTGSERHIAPPNVHVEMAERHGMFDDADGKLTSTPAMWQLIRVRDESTFHQEEFDDIVIDGKKQSYPVEGAAQIDPLPYLPDPLARSAAFRDLPGAPDVSIGRAVPGSGPGQPVSYEVLADPQPRPGSATIIEFGGRTDWQEVRPFRLALADGDAAPTWDPQASVLTVALPKGTTAVVPVSSCCDPEDLKYLGIWQWLREHIEHITDTKGLEEEFATAPPAKDRIAHILQLATEGGHGMLTPPHLLTLVHAVQQPIGRPGFGRLTAQLDPDGTTLQTEPESEPTATTELDVLTAWRKLGGTDAWLVGALHLHGRSTAKVDIRASWTDPFDPLTPDAAGNIPDPGEQDFEAAVDEVPLPGLGEGYLVSNGDRRLVGFYDPDHSLICFAPGGTSLGNRLEGERLGSDSMPRHQIGDTRHHVVTYTPIAASRYSEYFPKVDSSGTDLDFTRKGAPVTVHVPASARPVAPRVRYVVPTFGWERATSANQARSVRTGGGLRIYLDRPWHSSGIGELLGVSLALGGGGMVNDREEWKPFITQWGQDPLWLSTPLASFPDIENFTDAKASEGSLPLEERMSAKLGSIQRRVDVAGHEVHFDPVRKLYYCDLTVDTTTATYAPFIRLALVRYQPHALVDAKLSRVVLTDFAQLTPERALMVTADPYSPGVIRVAVSGPAPRGPLPHVREGVESARPTVIEVSVQVRDPQLNSDVAWSDEAAFVVSPETPRPDDLPGPDFILWSGSVRRVVAGRGEAGKYRLLVQEYELYESDDEPGGGVQLGKRLIYAETVPLDDALLQPPPAAAATTTM